MASLIGFPRTVNEKAARTVAAGVVVDRRSSPSPPARSG